MTTDYIIPTKKNPVFTAVCNDFGYIEESIYKMWNIRIVGVENPTNACGCTFACNYMDAVQNLHEWIKENREYVKGLSNITFRIEAVDGSVDKWGDVIYKTVYSITAAKAKKYLL